MAHTFLEALDNHIGEQVEVGLLSGDSVGRLLSVNGPFIRLATIDTGYYYDYGAAEITTVNLTYAGFVRILS